VPVLTGMCPFTVTLAAPSGPASKWGDVPYGGSATFPAHIEFHVRRVLGFDGREVYSTAQVTIPGDITVEPTHRITLPERMRPRHPVIVGVEKHSTGHGIHHTVLHLGGR